MKRVVITGMGVVSSLGCNVDTFWDNIKNSRHGFSAIERFDTSDFEVKYAAEIKNWDPTKFGIEKKEARRMDRFTQYALSAANMAIEDAGSFADGLDEFKIGVIVGSGIGGFETIEDGLSTFLEKGAKRVSALLIPMMIGNMAAGQIAIAHGYKGDNYAPVSACSSSNHAVGEAFRKIKDGYLDAAVTGGSEGVVTAFTLAGFNNMRALNRGDDPDRVSIPFDGQRSGFVMGEGAGILVLEELEHAKKRGAHIYAEIVGYGATDDAYHITSPDPQSLGAAKAMEFAVKEAGINPTDVDYINAHGTSTEMNDKYETGAIKLLFGGHAYKLAVSSTKSMTGHMLGAAGAVEGVICAKSLEEGVIPPTAGYKEKDPDCDLDYVTEGSRKQAINYALSNSFGFGGHNASVIYKKYVK